MAAVCTRCSSSRSAGQSSSTTRTAWHTERRKEASRREADSVPAPCVTAALSSVEVDPEVLVLLGSRSGQMHVEFTGCRKRQKPFMHHILIKKLQGTFMRRSPEECDDLWQ